MRAIRLAEHVNLFRVKPFYAFSGLTSRTGMSFLVLAYFIAAVRPDMVRDTPFLRVLIFAMLPTAVACFVLPLYGMHLRLVAEKDRLLAEANGRFETLLARLHTRVDAEILTDADRISQQLSSVAVERETISRLHDLANRVRPRVPDARRKPQRRAHGGGTAPGPLASLKIVRYGPF